MAKKYIIDCPSAFGKTDKNDLNLRYGGKGRLLSEEEALHQVREGDTIYELVERPFKIVTKKEFA